MASDNKSSSLRPTCSKAMAAKTMARDEALTTVSHDGGSPSRTPKHPQCSGTDPKANEHDIPPAIATMNPLANAAPAARSGSNMRDSPDTTSIRELPVQQ